MKTCGNCWYGPSAVEVPEKCKAPIPMWVQEHVAYVKVDADATACDCWRQRWVGTR